MGQAVDNAAQFQKCQLGRHLEGLLALMQMGRDVQRPCRGIIPALSRIALTPDNLNIVAVLQPSNESRVDRVWRETGLAINSLRCLIEWLDMIVPRIEKVADLLEGHACRTAADPVVSQLRSHRFAALGGLSI